MADDKKVTASTPDKQQDAAMAEDKKVTNSTPDEQQDADMIEMPEIFISDKIKESDKIARALRAMMAEEELQNEEFTLKIISDPIAVLFWLPKFFDTDVTMISCILNTSLKGVII